MKPFLLLLLFPFLFFSCLLPLNLDLVNGMNEVLDVTLISDDLKQGELPEYFGDSLIFINYWVTSGMGFEMESCQNKLVRWDGTPYITDREIEVCYFRFDTTSNPRLLSFKLPPKKQVTILWEKSCGRSLGLYDHEIYESIDTMIISGMRRGKYFSVSLTNPQAFINLIEHDKYRCRGKIVFDKKVLEKLSW